LVLTALTLAALALGPRALAGPPETRASLDRLGEVLDLRLQDGTLDRDRLLPAVVVSARARTDDSAAWFSTRAIEVLQQRLGPDDLRLCEACAAPRVWVEDGRMTWSAGAATLDEVAALDARLRGDAPPARSAIWLDEQAAGVSVRVVELSTGRVLLAQNLDPDLTERARTERTHTWSAEVERRARGDSLTQAFVDLSLFPRQHIALDWTDQWGRTNANFSGVTLTLIDPIVGVGAVHYRRLRPLNTQVGAKLVLALPTAILQNVGGDFDGDLLDPLVTAVGVVRVPFGRSNYGAIATLSTNGAFGLGVSLLNVHLLPVIP
jgi:hypothetical protein